MEFFHEGAALIEHYLREYGVLALFCTIFLESLGAPVPGESALIASSVMAAEGDLKISQVFLAVWIAAVLGDNTGYLIGRIGGRVLLQRYGWIVKLTPARLTEFEDLFRRRGAMIVVGARFVVVLRQLNGVIAGSMAMPWGRFLVANVIGAALWTTVWCLGPYFLGDLFNVRALIGKL